MSKRAQRPKVRNKAMHEAMVEIRRSSAAQPHRNRTRYSRDDFRRNAQNGRYDD